MSDDGPIKYGAMIPMSSEMIATADVIGAAMKRRAAMTPAERAAQTRAAAEARAAERDVSEHRAVTLDALLDKLGWSCEYAEHFVQPYCSCGEGMDGWEICIHADDLGLDPY